MALFPITNAEYGLFLEAGGYEDESLWPPEGQLWLRGEGRLDTASLQDYLDLYGLLVADTEGYIAQRKRSSALTDEEADIWRQWAALSEEAFLELLPQILLDKRQRPIWWHDTRYNRPNQPVVGVNWYEAIAYTAWISRITGKSYRLPTEVEWEWAARRNTRRYPWGEAWDATRCNSAEGGLGRPTPVGIYPHGSTPDGIQDLAGNVFEWTATLYHPYSSNTPDKHDSPASVSLPVIRGGSWYVRKERVRCAYRDWNSPLIVERPTAGFRLARTLSP
jgi:formylglycine-generating enzyme required for sulfatase activity